MTMTGKTKCKAPPLSKQFVPTQSRFDGPKVFLTTKWFRPLFGCGWGKTQKNTKP